MTIAVYPMSANPPTWGHADILHRASAHFDTIYWAIGINSKKKYLFSTTDRMEMMQIYVNHYQLENVIIDTYSGVTIRYAEKQNARILIKGLRNLFDFDSELQQATANRGMNPRLETFCLLCRPELSIVSSSLVRELFNLGEDISSYVHPDVEELMKQHLQNK